ncbi:hypothetical protein PUMCH_000174 [Australozyma saopauloensis]|uniref:Ubiquitin-protein ligase E3A N-terminal zinc-binding domain-containing protein n=1 Tax=Australozyma saopauloensis TaxID=291208 RepID=A0AAX4H331_9ASCO|nr:hypothetical protein PUMCH_000174 [[Candida] saopauloensis]
MSGSFIVQSSDQLPQHSDKCILPPSILKLVLDQNSELPHPLVLQLVGVKSVYVGVKEFTAPEDTVIVPRDVYDQLQSDNVQIHLADLPKSTFLKIKPFQFYSHITNWKYYLESFLSTKYTVLSKNQTFYYADALAGKTVELLVEDCNADAVVVVETNVVLDVVPLNDIMAAQQLEQGANLNILENVPALETDTQMTLEPFNQVAIQHIYSIDLRKQKNDFTISIECADDSPNVELICGVDKFLTLENFMKCSLSSKADTQATKAITIELKSDIIQNCLLKADDTDPVYLYVVPFAWDHAASITLQLRPVAEDEGALILQDSLEDSILCQNCGKQIQEKNYPLHEAYCLRNIKKCSCGEVFDREIPSLHWHCGSCQFVGDSTLLRFKHEKFFHSGPYKCNACDSDDHFETYVDLVEKHKGVECPAKLHECKFCHLVVPQGEATYEDRFNNLTHHESECGNKTVECFKCKKSVRNKDIKTHMQLHSIDNPIKSSSLVLHCSNVNCVNLAGDNSETKNTLQLCDTCYGPLYSTVHDQNHSKLQSRIERRYIIQLTKGCGQPWCDNKECATGGTKLDMKRAFSHIQGDLLRKIYQPVMPINSARSESGSNEFWFCVNESVHRKKGILQDLIAEARFPESSIYLALSAKGVEGARQYLIETA